MQATPSTLLPPELHDRVQFLWERTGDAGLRRLALLGEDDVEPLGGASDPTQLSEQELADWTSTLLMDCYRNTGDGHVFALLYELNEASFRQAIQFKLRRSASSVDARDVLQEVFLNIYRYPHRFEAEKADAFRNWGHRIVRNTVLKFLKSETKRARFTSLDEDVGQRQDQLARTPFRTALESESAGIADRAYLLYLNLYLIHFNRLSEKERRALTMVEVEGASYKEAAARLGIRLENLKMVIFRGRRKVLRGMHRSLARLDSLGTAPAPADPLPHHPSCSDR